jgi:hypothetical protein
MRSNLLTVFGAVLFLSAAAYADDPSFLSTLHHPSTIASTVPRNGDVNPYGVALVPNALVPNTTGALVANSVLVSNFNNVGNLQGTGTTIVQISPSGVVTPFAKIDAASLHPSCPGGVGLTTALVALRSGFVIVGSLPTTDGTPATAKAGCLIILNNHGTPVTTISGNGINGPWDMTALDMGTGAILFVTNVLNGTVTANGGLVSQGSVLRIALSIPMGGTPTAGSFTTIASTFDEHTDPAALVVGPTGLALSANGTLFVADTVQNRIAKISNAVFCTSDCTVETVAQGRALKQPLGLAIAPNGNILTVNGADGLLVETTPAGQQTGARFVDVSHSRNGAGTLFGLAVVPDGSGVYFVDDGNNTLNVLR